MTAKKCIKCGKTNHRFFTRCVEWGAKPDTDTRKPKQTGSYLKTALVLDALIILIIFVILPAVRYSRTVGQDFSEAVPAKPGMEPQIPEYPPGRTVGNNDLQITVSSARDGQNTYNANKFFIVLISLKNVRTTGNIQVSDSDFELIDSDGAKYFPHGIGSKVMYDLSPSQTSSGELTFVIPQKETVKKGPVHLFRKFRSCQQP